MPLSGPQLHGPAGVERRSARRPRRAVGAGRRRPASALGGQPFQVRRPRPRRSATGACSRGRRVQLLLEVRAAFAPQRGGSPDARGQARHGRRAPRSGNDAGRRGAGQQVIEAIDERGGRRSAAARRSSAAVRAWSARRAAATRPSTWRAASGPHAPGAALPSSDPGVPLRRRVRQRPGQVGGRGRELLPPTRRAARAAVDARRSIRRLGNGERIVSAAAIASASAVGGRPAAARSAADAQPGRRAITGPGARRHATRAATAAPSDGRVGAAQGYVQVARTTQATMAVTRSGRPRAIRAAGCARRPRQRGSAAVEGSFGRSAAAGVPRRYDGRLEQQGHVERIGRAGCGAGNDARGVHSACLGGQIRASASRVADGSAPSRRAQAARPPSPPADARGRRAARGGSASRRAQVGSGALARQPADAPRRAR